MMTLDPGDETLLLFTHYISKDEYQLREYMVNWIKEHLYFIENIGSYILKMKGLNVND